MPVRVPINPAEVYDEYAVALDLDLPLATLKAAQRRGELRCTRKGRRTFILGAWLLDWLAQAPPAIEPGAVTCKR